MKNEQWFYISDLDDFVDHVRSLVFKLFGEVADDKDDSLVNSLSDLSKEEIKEMDETLSHAESLVIVQSYVKKEINKKTKAIRHCLTDSILKNIIEDLNSRMISNILHVLVNKNILDSAYDEKQNDFIFWIKDKE